MPPRRTVARPVRDANPPQHPLPQAPVPSTSSQPLFRPQPGWPQQAAAFYPQMGYAPVQQPAWNGYPYYYYQQQQQQQQHTAWQAQQSIAPASATAYPQHPLPQVPPAAPQAQPSTSIPTPSSVPASSQPRWRPPPSECQPCRKRFSSVVQLIAHKAQHLKCTEGECTFEGDDKAISLHKQDRHLIFPPGRQQPKSRQQQQPQQSKKRSRVDHDGSDEPQEEGEDEEAAWAKRFANAPQIEGTSIKLDSPEAIKAWIEERKKKWPTARRIEEKAAQQASRPASAQQSNNSARGGRRGKQDQAHRAQYSQPLNLPVQSSAPVGNNSRQSSAAATAAKKRRVELPSKPSSDTLATSVSAPGLPSAAGNAGQPTPTFEATASSSLPEDQDDEDAGPLIESSARRNVPPAHGNEDPTPLDRPESATDAARQKQQNEQSFQPRNPVDGSTAGGPAVDHDSDSSSSLSSTSTSSSSSSSASSSSSDEDSDTETAVQAKKHKLSNGKNRAQPHQAPENTGQDKLPGPHDERIRRAPSAHRQFVSATRTGLLSKLLEHDVAHEMSDLVQVAEFLVRNQFLKGVELKPGDADHELIQEVQQQQPE